MDFSVNFTEISATIISRSFDIETCKHVFNMDILVN